jgi:hypothetical protein
VGGSERPPSVSALERLLDALESEGFAGQTLGGCHLAVCGDDLHVVREAGRLSRAPETLDAASVQVWDGRFRVSWNKHDACALDVESVGVRALGEAGWRRIREEAGDCDSRVRQGLPSFWLKGEVVAVPHLGYRNEALARDATFSAEFCNMALLGRAGALSEAATRSRELR